MCKFVLIQDGFFFIERQGENRRPAQEMQADLTHVRELERRERPEGRKKQ